MHSPEDRTTASPRLQRVWDVPVRITHAMLIACVAGAWLTRGAERADWHAAFGYVAVAALAFRAVWGFAGPAHARFASFAYSPREALAYLGHALRGTARHYTGHNPAGSWGVYLLLATIAATCITGVVASGALHRLGPLAGAVSFELGDRTFELHELLAWAVLATVALHLGGVAWGSRVHRENLARAMVTGRKVAHDADATDVPRRSALGAGLAIAAVAFAIGYLAWNVPRDVASRQAAEDQAKVTLAGQPWTKECGSCHLAYAPALLPFPSWERTLHEQDRHFGEDLSLSEAGAARLLREAKSPPPSWAAWKLAQSVPAGEAPLRITETRFWRHAHHEIPAARFKPPGASGRHDCEACHRDAVSGIFHPRMIQNAKPKNTP